MASRGFCMVAGEPHNRPLPGPGGYVLGGEIHSIESICIRFNIKKVIELDTLLPSECTYTLGNGCLDNCPSQPDRKGVQRCGIGFWNCTRGSLGDRIRSMARTQEGMQARVLIPTASGRTT